MARGAPRETTDRRRTVGPPIESTYALRDRPGRSRPRYAARCDRDIKLAIFVATLALLGVVASRVQAEPLDAVIRSRLALSLPAGLDVARVYLPAGLAGLDARPDAVAIELPRDLRAGRPSIKVTVRGHRSAWIPVAIATAVDVAIAQRSLVTGDVIGPDDIAIEHRAVADFIPASTTTLVGATVSAAIDAGAPIAARAVALPPPLTRGTQVEIEIWRGAVHVRGTGTLELAARPGEPASARLAATRIVVHGTLVAPATVVVGVSP